jgi:uncharacterized protein YgbK (DUF1537 family)
VTRVVTRVPREWPLGTEVLAVDLDVRERSNPDAARAISDAIRALGPQQPIFVKVDSTLRGPIAGLVAGALAASGRALAVVAPAFPEQGRHIRGGRLVVDGRVGPNLADILGSLATVVVDASDSLPLQEVAQQAKSHPEWLLVGSAGLARQLAPSHTPARLEAETLGPILVVAGSPTPTTRAQIEQLTGLEQVVVLATPATDTRDQGQAAAALAERVANWAQHYTPGAVVLTGGATAREVIHRIGATSLRLGGEVEPGVPIGTLEDGVWHGMPVVTKAGGFGTPETLLDVVRALGVSSPADAHDFNH